MKLNGRKAHRKKGTSKFPKPFLKLIAPLHWYPVFASRITHVGGDPNGFGKEMFQTYIHLY